MPASSRKRNKGKDRKAKQLIKKEERERSDANKIWRNLFSMSTECDHGCDVIISDDHPVSNFIDHFFMNLQYKGLVTGINLRNLCETHTHIWNNDKYKALAIGVLIRIGTNMLLHKTIENVYLAHSIIVLEHYNGTTDIDSVINSRVVITKLRDISARSGSGRRDCLKFFRKRTSCSCLKKKHLEARKTIPKMGLCWNCDKEMKRVSLSTCSRCMVIQYCSRECQVAGWAKHKVDCDNHVCDLWRLDVSARERETEEQTD